MDFPEPIGLPKQGPSARRCEEIYDVPDALTLRRLPDEVEEQFVASWEGWTEESGAWASFFEAVSPVPDTTLEGFLVRLNLVDEEQVRSLERLRGAVEGRRVKISGAAYPSDRDVQMLALIFAVSRPSELVVPYVVPTT